MNQKLHLSNIIAGIIVITSMILALVSGSNNLPYAVILLFLLCYWLQMKNFMGITKIMGLIANVLLLIWSLPPLLDYVFPFAP